MTDSLSDAAIYYTTNGTKPTTASTRCTGQITVSVSETITVIAVAGGYSNSAIAAAAFAIHRPAAPTAPSNLTATAGSDQVILNWTASVGGLVYRVYRSAASDGEANPSLKGGITATSYTDTSGAGGFSYCYEVTAVNVGGASPFSDEVCNSPVRRRRHQRAGIPHLTQPHSAHDGGMILEVQDDGEGSDTG
jgi:predicted phage tail protein